ncbi:MAG: uncharacterized protein H6Q68_2579 [Firmicutes bacterium]|nr:uncharacterized protein [Bacillota bacterium]
MIADSSKLSKKVKDPHSCDADNIVLTKEFLGGILVLTGANSAAGLRPIPVKNLLMALSEGG